MAGAIQSPKRVTRPEPQKVVFDVDGAEAEFGLLFTNNLICELEEMFPPILAPRETPSSLVCECGKEHELPTVEPPLMVEVAGILSWQRHLDVFPYRTLRRTLALLIGRDEREVGDMMIPERQREYGVAIGIAWAVANGADPTEAAAAAEEALGGQPSPDEADESTD